MITKNRVIKIFLTIMMVISILPIASKTAYADESGTPGNPWHIGLDEIRVVTAWLTSDDINKTLHISGTGNMKNFDADDHPWKEDREKITTIVFEEEGSVTSIGNNAFVGCTALTRITIDSSVAHIGDHAFNGCGNLSTVIFRPAAEKETLTIAEEAFATNQKLAYGSASMMRLYYGENAIQAKADLSDYNNKTLTWKTYSYLLSVGGVEVTDSNKDNIFEDSGTVRASYNPESNTLKLNGVNIQPEHNNKLYGIYYYGTDALNIYLESGSENIVGVNNFANGFIYGIYSTENAKISFSGTGKLKVTAGNGGTCSGIFAKGDMEINGSTVTSAASGYYNNGIVAKNLTINGGTVVSSANDLGEDTTTHGISVDTLVINTGAELTAIGKAGAISGAVKNAIAGTGWTDTAGIEGRTTISIKTEGKPLDGSIKKVQFPDDSVHRHDNVTFQPWTSTNSLPTKTGSYYLTEDVTLTSLNNWKIPEGVTIDLCLNGHNIVYKNVYNYYPVISVGSGAALNLYDCSENPGKISNNDSTGVNVYGTFTMNGGVITGCKGSGVIINDGTFTMNGGSITGNTCTGFGAGVNIGNGKSFVMNGGSITNNSAGKRGGGVYIYEGSFTMNGGTITGNSAKDLGGGVYVDGSFIVKGDINITNNKSGNDDHTDNVYLYKSNSNYNKIAFSDALSEGSKIGVTLGPNYGSVVFTKGYKTYCGTTDPKTVFTDDEASSSYDFYIKYGEVARLRHYTVTISPTEHGTVTADKNESPASEYVNLTVTPETGYHVSSLIYKYTNSSGEFTKEVVNNQIDMPPYNITVYATFVSHEHNFTYSADGATITAECTAANCDLPGSKAILTIAAPLHTTYGDGKDAAAQITDANAIQGDAKVVYQKKNGESYGEATETAPTDAGDYKASITLGAGSNAVTAFVEYTIEKADPNPSSNLKASAKYGQKLKDIYPYMPMDFTPGVWSWVDPDASVGSIGEHTYYINFTPDDTVNYKSLSNVPVTVTVGKADNPAEVTSTASVKKGGVELDLTNSVTRNGATGTVSYEFLDEEDKKGCELDGSKLISGNVTGDVKVLVSVGADDIYKALDTKLVTVTITEKYPQTITAQDVTATYGDTDKKVIATVTEPATGGGTISYAVKAGSGDYIDIDPSSGALTIKKAGTATVTVTAAATNDYAEATKDVTVTINKADPVATAPAASATYGQTLADVALANPEGNTPGTWAFTDAGTTSVGNAGQNTFKANFTPTDTVNYNSASNVDVTVTVAKADPVAEAPTGLTATYGQTLADVTLTNPEGNTPGTWTWADSSISVGDVGDNTFKANFTPTDSDNYNGKENVDVSINVSKADSAAAMVSPNNRTYDAAEKPLVTVSGEATGGTMNYALGENGTTAPAEGWSEDIPSATNADTYYVWYKVFGDDNHNDTEAVPVEVKVNTATLTVAAVNQNIKVGDAVPDLSDPVLGTHYTVTGLAGEDKLATAPTLTYKKGGSEVTPDSSAAGTYDIVASGADAGCNYTLTHTDAVLTISNKEVQTITAENVKTTYGATDAKVTATSNGDGTISYAVKEGSGDYIEVDPSSGALTIKKEGTATVVVTASETATYAKATKEVTVTINPVDKSRLQSAINAAKAFYDSIKEVSDYQSIANEVKTQIEAAEKALEEDKTQKSINEAESTLNNALAADLKNVADKLPGTDKVTLDNEEAIKAAYSAYNAMTDTQKALAEDNAKKKITDDYTLINNIRSGRYYAYSGDGGRWTRGSGSTLPFVFKHSAVDDVTYRSFRLIKVDGKMVYEYTYIKGSVKIDLLPDYLKTLSLGDHTLTAEFAGGMSATASFRVLKESSGGGDTPYIPPKTGIE